MASAAMRPIVVGPFYGEPGIEVLYWIPYLAYLWAADRVDLNRVHVITRGGAGCWYGISPDRVLDLHTLRPLTEIRHQVHRQTVETGQRKPYQQTRWDRSLIEQACDIWGLRKPIVLHPTLMSRVFEGWWQNLTGIASVFRRTQWPKLPAPELTETTLPPEYIAMRWYLRASLQPDPGLHKRLIGLVARISERMPVVLLERPEHVDDHIDWPIPTLKNVIRLPPVPLEQALAQHTVVISKAKAYLGTYGGMSTVALRLGIPSVSWYQSMHGVLIAHLLLTQAVAVNTSVPYYPVKTSDLDLLEQTMGRQVNAVARYG